MDSTFTRYLSRTSVGTMRDLTLLRAERIISFTNRRSDSPAKDTETPLRPARAVRPTLNSMKIHFKGQSAWMGLFTCEYNVPAWRGGQNSRRFSPQLCPDHELLHLLQPEYPTTRPWIEIGRPNVGAASYCHVVHRPAEKMGSNYTRKQQVKGNLKNCEKKNWRPKKKWKFFSDITEFFSFQFLASQNFLL